jgi:hypothetical protein
MAEYDRAYFKRQFESLPPKAMAVIALRAAMRVFPLLGERGHLTVEAFSFWLREDRARNMHRILRCFQSSAFVNSLKKVPYDAAAFVAIRAALPAGLRPLASYEAAAFAAIRACVADAREAAFVRDEAIAATNAVEAADAALNEDIARTAFAATEVAARVAAANFAYFSGLNRDALLMDIAQIRPSWIARRLRRANAEGDPISLLAQPLWLDGLPSQVTMRWIDLQRDLRELGAGFEVWIDWYQDRLDGTPFNGDIERQWALLSKEQLSQEPAEINAYLKGFRSGTPNG